jgi:hypothetical protein
MLMRTPYELPSSQYGFQPVMGKLLTVLHTIQSVRDLYIAVWISVISALSLGATSW